MTSLLYRSVASVVLNSACSYMQNAMTQGHMTLFKVDIFNMWKPSLVFLPFFHSWVVSKKNSPSVWTSENKWLYFGKPRNLWTYLSKQSLFQAVPLRLPNGFCIIHLDPYNNTGSLEAIFRFPRFPCRDTTLSGWEQPFSLSADVTCTNKQSWVWCPIA